jgi:hypothetical protein
MLALSTPRGQNGLSPFFRPVHVLFSVLKVAASGQARLLGARRRDFFQSLGNRGFNP